MAGLLRVRGGSDDTRSRRPAEMTSAVDERGVEASPKFWVLLTASLVSSLIMFDSNIVAVSLPSIGRSLGASFADVQWVISAYMLILISKREAAPMRAEAPAKMPCKLIDCRDPLRLASQEPCQNLRGKHDDEFEQRWRSPPTGCGGRRP
jgi:hypothetical protein